ncbi:MAG: hypothetical protein IJY03_04945 [Prevotella sp.]|nr:hypothetical protein [Prevotella sp.]
MKQSEYAENNVDARTIIANVLETLGMNAPAFSTATGIAYQRIYDLQRGRTKKFNPGVVNMIIAAFPQIRKEYLYTGDGPVLNTDVPADLIGNPVGKDGNAILERALKLQEDLMAKAERLSEKEEQLHQKEIELLKREHEVELMRAKLHLALGSESLEKKTV